MTPQQLMGLAALMLDFMHWLEEDDPGSFDVAMVSTVVDVIVKAHQRLVKQLAQ